MTDPHRLWLSEAEAAHLLGVCHQTLGNWRKKGWAPAYYRLHGRIWYKPGDIQTFIEGGRNA
jgi:predicted site-specific integrase-resolvase